MFCPYCGRRTDDANNFCTHCGRDLRAARPAAFPEPAPFVPAPVPEPAPAHLDGPRRTWGSPAAAACAVLACLLVLAVLALLALAPAAAAPASSTLSEGMRDILPFFAAAFGVAEPLAAADGAATLTYTVPDLLAQATPYLAAAGTAPSVAFGVAAGLAVVTALLALAAVAATFVRRRSGGLLVAAAALLLALSCACVAAVLAANALFVGNLVALRTAYTVLAEIPSPLVAPTPWLLAAPALALAALVLAAASRFLWRESCDG